MRKIKPELVLLLDAKLKDNAVAQQALSNKDARTLMLCAAEACVGETEVGGNNRGNFVELCQQTVDNHAEGESWCMAFVESMIAYAELKTGISSPIYSSEHCLTVWKNTKPDYRVKNIPLPGAIVIWRHGNTSSGHTGFVKEYSGSTMHTIEGNTGQHFSDGDGVYQKVRSTSNDGKMKVTGFLIPFQHRN